MRVRPGDPPRGATRTRGGSSRWRAEGGDAHRRGAFIRRPVMLAEATMRAYFADKVPRLGAALAFYTTVAVAPLLILSVAVARFFFHDNSARARILGEIQQLAGASASRAVAAVQPPANDHSAAKLATWIGLVTLVLGGCGVFVHLQDALNTIWRAPPHPGENWRAILRRRLFSFGTVVATGFVMLVSLVVSAALTWLGENASRWASWPAGAWEAANFLLSLAVITFLFAVIFRLLPDVRVRWRHVWTGALVTALLFVAGKTALGLYLAHSKLTSAYGAASSVIALLLWCYYAGQILFIGAEFTRVHTATDGGRKPMPREEPASQ